MFKSNKSYVFLGGFLFVVFIVVLTIFWIYGQHFDEIFPTVVFGEDPKRATYGVIGDFFGGILNPILTFCGFIFLIYTITQNQEMLNHSQEMLGQNKNMLELSKKQLDKSTEELALNRQEMELSRSEMEGSKKALVMQAKILEEQAKTQKIQRFESTFFNLLSMYQSIRSEMSYIGMNFPTARHKYLGSEVFRKLFESFLHNHLTEYERGSSGGQKNIGLKQCGKNLNGVKAEYRKFYLGAAGEELGGYFRIIYQIIKIVDSSDIENKSFYTGILRAQLSRYELIMLFYNGLSDFGSEKMLPLIKKYDFLQHIERDKLPQEHVQFLELFKPETPL